MLILFAHPEVSFPPKQSNARVGVQELLQPNKWKEFKKKLEVKEETKEGRDGQMEKMEGKKPIKKEKKQRRKPRKEGWK